MFNESKNEKRLKRSANEGEDDGVGLIASRLFANDRFFRRKSLLATDTATTTSGE